MTAPMTAPVTGWPMPPGTPERSTEATVEWLTVTSAMTRARVSRRTIRRWVAAGLVESRLIHEEGREVRLIRADTLPCNTGDDTGDSTRASHRDGTQDDTHAGMGDSHRDGVGDDTLYDTVTRQAHEISFLRAQLEVRAEELRRRDQAEGELRRLLLVSQQALSTAIAERQALPPAPDPPARRIRWWSPWPRS